MARSEFMRQVTEGIPDKLPPPREYDVTLNHAPKRKKILTVEEKKLAIKNALRYFPPKQHAVLTVNKTDTTLYVKTQHLLHAQKNWND